MRVTTVLRKLIGVTMLFVTGFEFTDSGLLVDVKPRWRKPRCGYCGRRAPGYDRLPMRHWRHLNFGKICFVLAYAPRRVECRHCGIRVEKVPWAPHRSRFTHDFEELTAYLAQITDKTQVTVLMGISWRTVGQIVERVVERNLDPGRLDNLVNIGVDEFSYRKRHRYLTSVVDHDLKRVAWAAPGKSSDTLNAFFDLLGERRQSIRCATIDMAGGYIKSITEKLPEAQIVYDRFHVQKLVSEALDKVRCQMVEILKETPDGEFVLKSKYALLKNPWNLNRKEKQKLRDVQENNEPLYRAYLLKETLAHALSYKQPKRAEKALKEWLAWASRSKLQPFVKAARTIRSHFQGVLAYIKVRLTNGIVEGFNNKLRVIARRSYGFHSPQPLIAMLYLCCGGITLNPSLPEPT